MASSDISAFSVNGDYFSSVSQDGKLRIWDTATCSLKQEYTPNHHLSSPCTCLTWLLFSRTTSVSACHVIVEYLFGYIYVDVNICIEVSL